ncbi:hypothetical protein QCD85_10540 [Paenibacillus sp. PsM32]|uniref:Uncharacterized protein n=1 Tax=Paenibacillus kyungheensis TaxID=1452732 RepID=A0AAX3M142_9BACL|nr:MULTISPECIES: hypothetical protein [Paenibacillus]MDN4618536.1 hypothetical protein [Paenibacillus sp. PsM32]WCT55871.1 hypothetical protein PQ456_22440 [Paenibacillus kyungheensis]
MFVRLFVNAKSETEARVVLEKVFRIFSPILENKEIKKIEPYWKMDEVYIVEITMLISENQTESKLNRILECIANKWIRFGDPVTELLASDTTENCIFMLEGIKMINIQFE